MQLMMGGYKVFGAVCLLLALGAAQGQGQAASVRWVLQGHYFIPQIAAMLRLAAQAAVLVAGAGGAGPRPCEHVLPGSCGRKTRRVWHGDDKDHPRAVRMSGRSLAPAAHRRSQLRPLLNLPASVNFTEAG